MAIPPAEDGPNGAESADDSRFLDSLLSGDTDDTTSVDETQGGSLVGVLFALAFIAFLITYAIAGQEAAGIAFWAVMFGLPALLFIVSALGAAWRGNRRDDLLEVATLAVRLSERQQTIAARGHSDESDR
jgi:hypothetical protein